jgi:hypothetical protein
MPHNNPEDGRIQFNRGGSLLAKLKRNIKIKTCHTCIVWSGYNKIKYREYNKYNII